MKTEEINIVNTGVVIKETTEMNIKPRDERKNYFQNY